MPVAGKASLKVGEDELGVLNAFTRRLRQANRYPCIACLSELRQFYGTVNLGGTTIANRPCCYNRDFFYGLKSFTKKRSTNNAY